jgi:hypothetical protein
MTIPVCAPSTSSQTTEEGTHTTHSQRSSPPTHPPPPCRRRCAPAPPARAPAAAASASASRSHSHPPPPSPPMLPPRQPPMVAPAAGPGLATRVRGARRRPPRIVWHQQLLHPWMMGPTHHRPPGLLLCVCVCVCVMPERGVINRSIAHHSTPQLHRWPEMRLTNRSLTKSLHPCALSHHCPSTLHRITHSPCVGRGIGDRKPTLLLLVLSGHRRRRLCLGSTMRCWIESVDAHVNRSINPHQST